MSREDQHQKLGPETVTCRGMNNQIPHTTSAIILTSEVLNAAEHLNFY